MENFERVGSETGNDRQLLLVAVVVSLLLHLSLLVTLFNYGSLGSDEAPPAAISVSFVTSNPFDVIPTQPDEVQEPVPENVPPAEEVVPEEPPEIREEPAELELPSQDLAANDASLEDATVLPTADESLREEPPELLPPPSAVAIRNSVLDNFQQQQRDDRSWASGCTELRRMAGVVGCAQQERPDYSGVEESDNFRSVVEYHNPPRQRDSYQENLPAIASQSGQLAASLAQSSLPPGMADFVMEGVESSITLYSNSGNRVLQHMDRMVDRSEAALLARELYTPWVQFQMLQRQQRQYQSRQDVQQRENCRSPKLYIMAPADIVDCMAREGNPFLLLPFNLNFKIEF